MQNSSATPQGLRITEEQFNELYPDLAGSYDFFNNPIPFGASNALVEKKYFKSKLWRLNNLYTIINKDGEPEKFKMNYAQHRAYAASRQHSRIIILKSRQQGISTLWLVSYFDDALWCKHLNLGLMAQGTDEATTLLERAKFLWHELSPAIKKFLNARLTADNATKFAFSNGSTIFIRVSFRSATLQRLHISEFGKIANSNPKRAKETKTGTLQAIKGGNTAVIESTAEGRNDFQFMWDAAVKAYNTGQLAEKDFLPVFLPWIEDPDCVSNVDQTIDSVAEKYFQKLEEELNITLTKQQKNFWIVQYRELGDDIYQEYPATPHEAFTASRDGTYYGRLYNTHVVENKRVVKDLYDPNLGVEVFFDLGMDDYFVMVFVQWYRGQYRIIDEYIDNGRDLVDFIDIAVQRGYNIVNWKFPHDIAVRELMATGGGRAKSREELVREYFKKNNIKGNIIKLQKDRLEANGIEATRAMLKKLWIDAKCEYMISCFLNFSKKYDERRKIWMNIPEDSDYSHGADCARAIAQHTVELQSLHESRYVTPKTHKTGRESWSGGAAL